MKTHQELVGSMILSDVLKSPQIIDAFETIDRKYFVSDFYASNIYVDAPLPIGNRQTISQPSTVAFMLEHLSPQAGEEILDIGSGSGWTTSLLSHIVGEKGAVIGIERVDELVEQGEKNLAQFCFTNSCHIQKAGEELGLPNKQFDKILVSASAEEIPHKLFDQLKEGGTLVIPIQHSIFKFKKLLNNQIKSEEFKGFAFVPLIV